MATPAGRSAAFLLAAGCLAACGSPGGRAADGGEAPPADAPHDGGTTDGTGADAAPPADAPPGCNPLAPAWDCLLPFPSDVFLVADPALPSGRRVALPAAGLPAAGGEPIDFTRLHPVDGFSHLPQILVFVPGGVDPRGLPFLDAPERSLAADSPTVILEADTGRRVLHFAELDPSVDDPARQPLVLRPLERLRNGTRHVVALRRLTAPGGAPIAAPEGFRRVRDGQAGGDPALAALAARYGRDVFPALARAGVERDALALAWDFTTASEACLTGDLLAVRAATMAALAASPPRVTVTEVDDAPSAAELYRTVEGTIRVPLFVESTEPGAPLRRDAAGRVSAAGEAEVPFTAIIPRSVGTGAAARPARLLAFGHGMFGSRHEIEEGFVRGFVERHGMVAVAVDWWGMSAADVAAVGQDAMLRPHRLLAFTDRVHQAMANQIALAEAARTSLAAEPALAVDGAPPWDPSESYFYGISQGHLLGGTYLALAPRVSRGVLGSGGAGLTLIISRARAFGQFVTLLGWLVPDPLDQAKLVALAQMTFDRIDPITYAPHVTGDLYAGGPAERRVLLQIGIGDAAVPNVAAHVHARALGAIHLLPAPRPIPALPAAEGPLDGSAIVEFDFGLPAPLPGTYGPPAQDNPVHEAVRRLAAGQRQIDAFLRPAGRIANACDGACDPE